MLQFYRRTVDVQTLLVSQNASASTLISNQHSAESSTHRGDGLRTDKRLSPSLWSRSALIVPPTLKLLSRLLKKKKKKASLFAATIQ